MKGRGWVVLVGLLLAMVGSLFGNGQPVPVQVITVRQGSTALFSIATGDVTGYAFVILEVPSNGILIGIPPHLIYIPRDGFLGTDWISFASTSPSGVLETGIVKVLVLGPEEVMAMPVLLSEGELAFSGPTYAVDRYRLVLGLQQRFRYFEQSLRATWTEAGFTGFVGTTRVELEGTWPSPWRLPITSTLDFDPTIPGLKSWTVNARTTLLGATWISTFFFSGTDPQTGSYTTFQVEGTVGALSFESLTKFIHLTPTFGEQKLVVRGPWICEGCPTKWELGFLQTKDGFDHLSFLVKDVGIPCPGCGPIQTFFDLKVTFTVDEKTIEPALRVVSSWAACVRPFVSLPTPTGWFGLEGIDLYGIEIKCEIPPGYTLRLATSFNLLKDSVVTGYVQFFELWQVEGPVVPCCGNPGRFQISAYFKRSGGTLFGTGMWHAILYFPVSREVLVNVGLKLGEVDPADPTKTWVLTVGSKGLF